MITQNRLKELIHYNPLSGSFVWIKPRQGVKLGTECGRISPSTGYRDITIDRKSYRACRLAFLYQEGKFPPYDVDHINRIKCDDKWENLRKATRTQNSSNINLRKNNTSGFRGVTWDSTRKKWRVQARIGGKKVNLGRFVDYEDAVNASKLALKNEFGEFYNESS